VQAIYAFGGEFAPLASAADGRPRDLRRCRVALDPGPALPAKHPPLALNIALPRRYPDAPPYLCLEHGLSMMEFPGAAQAALLAAARGACAELAGEPQLFAAVTAANEASKIYCTCALYCASSPVLEHLEYLYTVARASTRVPYWRGSRSCSPPSPPPTR
jgi:RWD domain